MGDDGRQTTEDNYELRITNYPPSSVVCRPSSIVSTWPCLLEFDLAIVDLAEARVAQVDAHRTGTCWAEGRDVHFVPCPVVGDDVPSQVRSRQGPVALWGRADQKRFCLARRETRARLKTE